MAAMLSCCSGNADKIRDLIAEATRMGISIFGPNINKSGEEFTPHVEGNSGYILFGLSAIKGVGDIAAKNILSERTQGGSYADFNDFIGRVDSRVVNKRVLEALVLTGAFDDFGYDRKHLIEHMPSAMQEAATMQRDKSKGQMQLFDTFQSQTETIGQPIATESALMSMMERLRNERELLGFYVSGNPLENYEALVPSINVPPTGDLSTLGDRYPFRICGVVGVVTKKITKRDNRTWAFFSFETENDQCKINCFPDTYERVCNRLESGCLAMVTGNVRVRDGEISFNASDVEHLDRAIAKITKTITWVLDGEAPLLAEFLDELKDFVHNNDGNMEHALVFEFCDGHQEKARLAGSLRSSLDMRIIQNFSKNPAVKNVKFSIEPLRTANGNSSRYGTW
jgi:DNA polymerase-3 subunit alpha